MARCTSLVQKSIFLGRVWLFATRSKRSTNSLTPSFLLAEMGTTGMPSASSRHFISMLPPEAVTSSIIFSASTIGSPNSITWSVKYRLRSMLVASTMLMTASGLPCIRKSRVTTSSAV